jgi:predicted MFS family arabinose efflux permease
LFIAALGGVHLLLGWRWLPELRGHLPDAVATDTERAHPFAAMHAVLCEANSRRAFLFMALLMLGGFTVVPYITIYATANVGIRQEEVPWLYLSGGFATLFTARLIGRFADRYGKLRVFRGVAFAALLPLFVLTHLPPVPLWAMILCATVFFVLVPGRMVPAMALITAAVEPHWRGTFLALNSAVMNLACGLAAWLGGLMMTSEAGRLVGYGNAGFLAMGATLATVWLAGRIRLHPAAMPEAGGQHAVPPAPTFTGRDT